MLDIYLSTYTSLYYYEALVKNDFQTSKNNFEILY